MCCFISLFSSVSFSQNPNSNPNAQQWKLNGNNADSTKFVGTTNNVDLVFKRNTIEGFRLRNDTSTKFLGDVYLDKLKEIPPIVIGPPKEVFLKVDNMGKIISTDKSGLLKSIYTSGSTCLSTGVNVTIPIWSALSTPTYGILYTGVDCPAKVGIGTDNPITTLDVRGGGFVSDIMGINIVPTSFYQLDIKSPLTRTAGIHLFNNHPTPITTPIYGIQNVVDNNNIIAYSVTNNLISQDVFVVKGDGTINIKTDITQNVKSFYVTDLVSGDDVFKILGNGDVYATKVIVQETPFPDYVFNADYNLMSLTNLEDYIYTNKHLPNMPTAKEVETKGADLGEINRILVEKVEELTLYTIQQQKSIELLMNEVEKLKNK